MAMPYFVRLRFPLVYEGGDPYFIDAAVRVTSAYNEQEAIATVKALPAIDGPGGTYLNPLAAIVFEVVHDWHPPEGWNFY